MKQPVKSVLVVSTGAIAIVGLVLAPVIASAATQNANTVINANVAAAISITSVSPVDLAITPTAAGAATNGSDTVTVSTNRTTGYNLQLADADATNTLVNGGNTLAAASGTFASPAALGVNTWGFRVDGAGTFGAGPTTSQTNAASLTGTWAAVPVSGSPVTLKTTAVPAVGSVTTVWYGAMVDLSKPEGTYTDTVTYTATTN